MSNSYSSHNNPLAARIAESAALLESFATSVILFKPPHFIRLGGNVLRAVFPLMNFADEMDDLLRSKGIDNLHGPEEIVSQLFISLIDDVNEFATQYHDQLDNTDQSRPTTSQEPITRSELIGAVDQSVKVTDLLVEMVEDPDLLEIFKIVVPEDYACKSTDEQEKLKEFISAYKANIKNRVNEDIPEYIFQLLGEFWEIRFGGKIIHLKDSKGLQHINTLLKNPHKPIRADSLTAPQISDNKRPSNQFDQISETSSHGYSENSSKTYTEMTHKILELENILEELVPGSDDYYLAEEHLKAKRKERSRFFNRSGQERPQDSGEKARQSVLNAIKTAKGKIKKDLPDLFMHIERYLDTGFECIYDPPESELKNWQF